MAANRTISIRLTVAEADQFRAAFQQAGAAGQAAMNTLTQSVAASSAALQAHTQTAGLANYQIIELTESAHKFTDIVLSGGSAIRGLEFELPKFIGIAGGVTNALGAVAKALPLLAFGGAIAGIYELGKAADEQQSRMRLLGQQVRATRDDYDAYAATLEKTARQLAISTGLSTQDARSTVNTIGTNPNFSGNSDDIRRLTVDSQNLSVVLHTDLATATKVVTSGLDDAAKAAKNLEEQGFAGFTPELVRSIQLLQDAGKYSDAFATFLQTVEARTSGAARAGLTPFGDAMRQLHQVMNETREDGRSFAETLGDAIDKLAARGILNLAALIDKIAEIGPALRRASDQADEANKTMIITSDGAMVMPSAGGKSPPPADPASYVALRNSIAQQYGVDPDLIAALNHTEGHRNADGSWQTSPSGAVGGFQLLPGTFADMQKKYGFTGSITDDDANTRAGVLYYRDQLQREGGDPTRAYYDYHDGPGAPYTSQAAIFAAGTGGIGSYRGRALITPTGTDAASGGYNGSGDDMINASRKSDEALSSLTEGTRAQIGEKLAATLEGIEKQLQTFETSGRQNTVQYTELLQREQSTRAAIYNNVDPQTQALREGQRQLDSGRLARRYGYTPADDQLAASMAQGEDLARTTGSPFTDADKAQREAQVYEKANMELSRLQGTQDAATASNERLAAAYGSGAKAVAELTAKNDALKTLENTLPETAPNYVAARDKQTASNLSFAQSLADIKAKAGGLSDAEATVGLYTQIGLLNSGEGTNQQAQDYAAFQARQANQTASPAAQDAVANQARQRVEAEQQLASVKANYNELTSFSDSAMDKIGSSITSAFASGKDAAVSFGSITKSIMSELEQEFVKLAIINPLKNAFAGNDALPTASGVLGSIFGTGAGNGAATNAALQSLGGMDGPATASQVAAARAAMGGSSAGSGAGIFGSIGTALAGGIAKSLFSGGGSSAATNAALAGLSGADGPATLAQVQAAQGAITNGTAGGGFLDSLGSLFADVFHGGGIVGMGGVASRMVDPRVFYPAPRMHSGGIAGDEVPAVLQTGEAVLTPGQMAALGKGMSNGSGGGDTHFNFNVNAQGAGPREIDTLKSQIPLMALQAVQQAASRGGSFAKAVRGG